MSTSSGKAASGQPDGIPQPAQVPWKFSKRNAVQNAPNPDLTTDPWHSCRTKIESYDKQRCDTWNDDISNLITFTGLFSAVVTTFLIESYKRLQPDPDDITHALLQQIVNNSSSRTAETPFTPSTRDITINVLWFISLSLSLSVALIGLMCKQWISEYRRRPALSPKHALRLRQWRYQGMERWQLPDIIALLPMIQQLAVFLFLGGLFNFLRDLNEIIALSVLWILGFTAAFSLLTSILPALWMALSRDTRYPCPFKSPQAWLVLLLFHPFTKIPFLLSKLFDQCRNVGTRFKKDSIDLENNGAAPVHNATPSDVDGLPIFLFGKNWTFFEKHILCSQPRTILRKELRCRSLAWMYKHLSHDPEVESNLLRCLSTLPTADAKGFFDDDSIYLNTNVDPNDDSDADGEKPGLSLWLRPYYLLFGEQMMHRDRYLIPELCVRKIYEGLSEEKSSTEGGDSTQNKKLTLEGGLRDKINSMKDPVLSSQIKMLSSMMIPPATENASVEEFFSVIKELFPGVFESASTDHGKGRHPNC